MIRRIALLAVVFVMGYGAVAAQELATPATKGFEDSIRSNLAAGEYRKTFAAVSDYESHLAAQYKPAAFENDKFRSEAAHMSFTSPFAGWKSLDAGIFPSMGPAIQILLAIAPEGKKDAEDKLAILRFRFQQVLDRAMGSSGDSLPTGESNLQFAGRFMSEMLGMVRKTTTETVGSREVVVTDISTAIGNSQMCLMVFANEGDVYAVLLFAADDRYTDSKSKTRALIESVKFDVNPPDKNRISAALSASYTGNSLDVALARAKALGQAGEYDEAMSQLDTVRKEIAKKMPEPKIDGNAYVNSAYGVRLANPDKELAWQFIDAGGQKMAILAQESSVQTAGMGLMVLDMDLIYGAQLTDLALAEGPREFLANAGRGGAQATGRVMGEKFTKINGHTAYQAEVQPGVPGLAINVMVIDNGRSPVMALMMLSSANYDEELAKYLAILEKIELDCRPTQGAVTALK